MKMCRNYGCAAARLLWLLVAMVLMQPTGAKGATEQTFDVLQIGTQTYSNVTVTTKAKTYVFLMHSSGMANIKVADLPQDVKDKLGYVDEKAKARTNAASAWAKQTVARMETPQVKEMERQVEQRWRAYFPTGLPTWGSIDKTRLAIVSGIALLLYFGFCYCCMLICKKTDKKPGALVWLPLLKQFPLLRAAGMSGWWVLSYLLLVPIPIVAIIWCFKIAKACRMSAWVGLLLVLPVTNLFAFLYLAFSDGAPKKEEPRRVEVMSLDLA